MPGRRSARFCRRGTSQQDRPVTRGPGTTCGAPPRLSRAKDGLKLLWKLVSHARQGCRATGPEAPCPARRRRHLAPPPLSVTMVGQEGWTGSTPGLLDANLTRPGRAEARQGGQRVPLQGGRAACRLRRRRAVSHPWLPSTAAVPRTLQTDHTSEGAGRPNGSNARPSGGLAGRSTSGKGALGRRRKGGFYRGTASSSRRSSGSSVHNARAVAAPW